MNADTSRERVERLQKLVLAHGDAQDDITLDALLVERDALNHAIDLRDQVIAKRVAQLDAAEAERDAARAEVARLREALAEVSRRNQIMRSHMNGRLEGYAADHFFRPLAAIERIITEALEHD